MDINCDMGESYGRYQLIEDEALMPYLDACNIACGFHAGDPSVIDRTVKAAIGYDLKIGAHPSFPDLQGFGRRTMDISKDELTSIVRYQISSVKGLVESFGGRLNHVKAHGALYILACYDLSAAEAIAEAIHSFDQSFIIYAPFESVQAEIASEMGIKVHYEAFIDRQYHDDLSLVSRNVPGAVLTDCQKAFEQYERIVEKNQVCTHEGNMRTIRAETLCIHGDNPSAIEILKQIKKKFNSKK